MANISSIKKYEMMILLIEEFNESEMKRWVFNYAKNLRKYNASDISVISLGKRQLAYSISKKTKGQYIQLNFSSVPKHLINFSKILRMDPNVLRFVTFNK